MIKGIGIDLVDLERLRGIVAERPKFAERVLSPGELEAYQLLSPHRKIEFLGGRFACKEAYAKALGTGLGPIGFQEIEVLNRDNGQPVMTVVGEDNQLFVSISHTEGMAVAQVIIEQKNNLD